MAEKICCLDGHPNDPVVLTLQPKIREFVIKIKNAESVDGILVAFGTLVFDLEEISPLLKLTSGDALEKVFRCVEVSEALRPLAGHVDLVEHMVSTDPRHRIIRPYLRTLLNYLNSLPPVPAPLVVARPPLHEIERYGRYKRIEPRYIPPGEMNLDTLPKEESPSDAFKPDDSRDVSKALEPGRSRKARQIPVKVVEPERFKSTSDHSKSTLLKVSLVAFIIIMILMGIVFFLR